MDEAIQAIGFGRYQKIFLVIGTSSAVLSGAVMGILVFLTYTPDHRCAIPGFENDTYHHQLLTNSTMTGTGDRLCSVQNYSSLLTIALIDLGNEGHEVEYTEPDVPVKCDRWVYDNSVFISTVTEFNFVCDRAMTMVHCRMLFFAGSLMGALVFGVIGDMFGRKTSYVLALVLVLGSCISLPWVSNVEQLMVLMFLSGAGGTGNYANILVIQMEFVDKSKRVLAAVLPGLGWVGGFLYVIVFAYFIRDWRTLEMAVFYPYLLVLGSIWLAISMGYFGLTINSGNLSGNLFVEYVACILIEIPAYLLVLIVVRVGRKSLHITLVCIGGLSCIATIFPVVFDKTGVEPLIVALATLGKFAITSAFGLAFVYTSELFPTPQRSTVLGASSCLARMGGMAAPYVAGAGELVGGKFSDILPLLIFGGFTLCAGLMCIFLPETKGVELPETVEEALNISRNKKNETFTIEVAEKEPLKNQFVEDELQRDSHLTKIKLIESDSELNMGPEL